MEGGKNREKKVKEGKISEKKCIDLKKNDFIIMKHTKMTK